MLAAQDMWEKGREDLGRWKDNAEDKKKKGIWHKMDLRKKVKV